MFFQWKMAKATTQTCLKNKGALMKQGREEPVRVGLHSGTQLMAPDLTLLISSWVCCPAVASCSDHLLGHDGSMGTMQPFFQVPEQQA